MAICSHCGAYSPDNYVICSQCGAQLVPSPNAYTAPIPPMYGGSSPAASASEQPYYLQPGARQIQYGGIMAWSIVLIVFGGGIFGILSLIYLTEINKSASYLEAKSKYSIAKKLCIVGSIIVGVTVLMLIFFYGLLFTWVMRLVNDSSWWADAYGAFKVVISTLL